MSEKNSSHRFSWQEYGKDCVHLATFVFFHLLIAGICQYLCLQALQLEPGFKEALFSLMLYLAHYGSIFAGFAVVLMLFRFFGKRFSAVFSLISGWLILLLLVLDTGVFLQWKFHINMTMVALFLSPAGAELVTFPLFMYVVGTLGILGGGGGDPSLVGKPQVLFPQNAVGDLSRRNHQFRRISGVECAGFLS